MINFLRLSLASVRRKCLKEARVFIRRKVGMFVHEPKGKDNGQTRAAVEAEVNGRL